MHEIQHPAPSACLQTTVHVTFYAIGGRWGGGGGVARIAGEWGSLLSRTCLKPCFLACGEKCRDIFSQKRSRMPNLENRYEIVTLDPLTRSPSNIVVIRTHCGFSCICLCLLFFLNQTVDRNIWTPCCDTHLRIDKSVKAILPVNQGVSSGVVNGIAWPPSAIVTDTYKTIQQCCEFSHTNSLILELSLEFVPAIQEK